MADVSVAPALPTPAISLPPPARLPEPRSAPRLSAGSVDPLDLSTEALVNGQLRDKILVKMLIEGKDYQTARREALEEAQSGTGVASAHSSQAGESGTVASSFQVEATSIQVTQIHAEIRSGDTSFELDATQVQVTHIEVSAQTLGSPASRKQDPLLIDMSGDGPRTSGADGARDFDLQGNGSLAPTSFVQGDSAFLALDRDGNGTIDSGRELFGDQHGAADGYEELRKFDTDGNGRIDAQDPVYGRLELLYGDGRRTSLDEAGIQSISLGAVRDGRTTGSGDDILRAGTLSTADGRTLNSYAMALQTFDTSA